MKAKPILCAAAAMFAVAAGPAGAWAEDGVWKVGASYVVRADELDLSRPDARAELLGMVETAARRLCRDEGTRRSRDACESEVVAEALADAAPEVTRAVEQARRERGTESWVRR